MDTVIAAGAIEVVASMAMPNLAISRAVYAPLLPRRNAAIAFLLRQGKTSLNAVAPDALTFEGGMTVA